jgi:acetolactate synthase small subunit
MVFALGVDVHSVVEKVNGEYMEKEIVLIVVQQALKRH